MLFSLKAHWIEFLRASDKPTTNWVHEERVNEWNLSCYLNNQLICEDTNQLNVLSYPHCVASHQSIIVSSLPPFHCRWLHVFISIVKLTVILFGLRKVVHGCAHAVIFALHVTLGWAADCRSLKHVTLKNVVKDDIFVDNKLEVLTIHCWMCHAGEGQVENKQHDLEIFNDAHSNARNNTKKKI